MILKRLENSRFSQVLKKWDGDTAVLIASGPSLTPEQVELVRAAHENGDVRCIAVNTSYLLADFASIVYFADSHFWKWHQNGIDIPGLGLTASEVKAKFASFKGQKCTIENSGGNVKDDAVHMLRNRNFPSHGVGLSLDPCALVTGRNSGFQALNLAVLAGAKRIILIGYDGQPAHDGKSHFFGDHPRPTPMAAYPLYVQAMKCAKKEIDAACVQVVNCSPGSAIDCFEMRNLEEVLP